MAFGDIPCLTFCSLNKGYILVSSGTVWEKGGLGQNYLPNARCDNTQ